MEDQEALAKRKKKQLQKHLKRGKQCFLGRVNFAVDSTREMLHNVKAFLSRAHV